MWASLQTVAARSYRSADTITESVPYLMASLRNCSPRCGQSGCMRFFLLKLQANDFTSRPGESRPLAGVIAGASESTVAEESRHQSKVLRTVCGLYCLFFLNDSDQCFILFKSCESVFWFMQFQPMVPVCRCVGLFACV